MCNYSRSELITAFKETRSETKYNKYIDTKVYTEDDILNIRDLPIQYKNTYGCICGIQTDSITEALKHSRYVGVLNFADGYGPGGLVLRGARTQEESLCRSTNLYESLIEQQCIDKYYRYNRENIEFKNGKSSDRIIYSRNIAIMRDANLEWLEQARFIDVITSPAPVEGTATEDEIKRRMKNILKVANDNRLSTLILGCWGCGAFGNKWSDFNDFWLDVIEDTTISYDIVFATRENKFYK